MIQRGIHFQLTGSGPFLKVEALLQAFQPEEMLEMAVSAAKLMGLEAGGLRLIAGQDWHSGFTVESEN